MKFNLNHPIRQLSFWPAKMGFIEVQMGEYNGPMCLMKEPMMSNSIPSMMILYI